jgi:hypothetical protein
MTEADLLRIRARCEDSMIGPKQGAVFLAAAREDVLLLLAEVGRLRAGLEGLAGGLWWLREELPDDDQLADETPESLRGEVSRLRAALGDLASRV